MTDLAHAGGASVLPIYASWRAVAPVSVLGEITEALGRAVLPLLLISAWIFSCYPRWKHEAMPASAAAQPKKRACSAALLAVLRVCLSPLKCVWQLGRRHFQRRRLYAHFAAARLERIIPALCGTPSPLSARALPRASAPGSHGIHDWHEALPAGFLTPVEVAACRSPPEVSSHVQRLLADRWWELEEEVVQLEPVPEDNCIMLGWCEMPEPAAEVEAS